MDYKVAKVELDKIRAKYSSAGDVLFRVALQYVIDCGRQVFEDDDWVKEQLDIIDRKHEAFEREKKMAFVSREFEKASIECAQEIAKVDAYNLLIYIQKEVWLGGEGIDHKRAVRLLKWSLEYIENDNGCNNTDTYEAFECIGLTDDEIRKLNFGYLIPEIEEDEE